MRTSKKKEINKVLFAKAAFIVIAVAATMFFNTEADFAAVEKPRFIAHGGGTIEGYETTNSVEAVMRSIADGYRLIELDLGFSSDSKLIMIHDWGRTASNYFGTSFSRRLSESEFEKILINGKFHTLTFNMLTKILDEAEDVRIVTDVKDDNLRALSAIAEKYPDYVNRMIPQIYSYDQYNAVKQLGYRDIILTLYAMHTVDYDELIHFIRNHKLFAVTVGDTHDYTIKDLKYRLADDGVIVYYHPVRDFETALDLFNNGVYGVYSNKIIPADFEGPARSYYLLEDKVRLCDLTVNNKSFKALKDVKIKNGADKMREYLIDGGPASDALIKNLAGGKHELKITLTLNDETVAEMDYFLWSGDLYMIVLDKKYEYRLNEFKNIPDIYEVLSDPGTVSEELKGLLTNSLIVKAGEYYGYSDGKLLIFQVKDEFLYSQKYTNGSVMSPLAECIKAVGADSVSMDSGRYVYVRYNGKRTMMMANTSYISQGISSSRLKTPLTIYRDKTMASGEIYKTITGRDYIDNQELMVLLPEGVKASEIDHDEIFEAASMLFDAKE